MPRLKPNFLRTQLPGAVAVAAALGFAGAVGRASEPAFGDVRGPLGQDPKFIEQRIEWADFCAVEAGCSNPSITDIFFTYRVPEYMQKATLQYFYESERCQNVAKRYAFGENFRIAARPYPGDDPRPACLLPDE